MAFATSGARAVGLFHVTSIVDDLTALGDLHRRVFGVETATLGYFGGRYATYCLIGDVAHDNMCPDQEYGTALRQFRLSSGQHWFPPGLLVEDMQDLIYQLRHRRGLRIGSIFGEPVLGAPSSVAAPDAAGPPDSTIGFAHPWEAGLEWELVELDPDLGGAIVAQWPHPQLLDGFEWPQPPQGSVGAIRHARHTIVAEAPDTTVGFLVDILGGRVFGEGEDTAQGTRGTYVVVGEDAASPVIFEIAAPVAGGPARRDLERMGTTYHCLTYEVADLADAASHLEAVGVAVETAGDDLLVTDPAGFHGLRYGFTGSLLPGDPRGG
ncbi:MAG: VOC family protein [Solirubrobacterales bacterium]|nr:VOC family protein [Solirubrobacterales bacterium]